MNRFLLIIIILLLPVSHVFAIDFLMNTSINTVNCSQTHNFFDSGGSGGNYSDNESFIMTFNPDSPGQFINIVFSSFNLQLGDQITFFDGASLASPLIGTYTQTSNPGTIAATNDGSITVVFASNFTSTNSGWRATINCSATPGFSTVALMTNQAEFVSCNAVFYDQGGSNNNYRDNQNQTMVFYPENPGEYININFSSFNLSSDDEISFYDGTSVAATLIGSYTQTSNPGNIAASNASGAITVVFFSDFTSTSSGWQANITCTNSPSYPNVALMTDGAEFTSCNAVFYDQGGANNNYRDNQVQTMTFYPENAGEFINIDFSSFNLQLDDEISFYDGTSTSAPFMGTYTQNSNPGIVGASNADGAITVVFFSDFTSTSSGWEANITCTNTPSYPTVALMTDGAVFTSCNAMFYDQGGANNNYRDNQVQTMTFYPANAGEFINIDFSSFNLQLGDEISFYDGTSTAAPFMGTYSQTSNPGIIGAANTDGAITVVFTSNFTSTNSGWRANITCSNTPSFPNTAVMTNGAVFTSCNAVFYDQGGTNDNYQDNQNQTMVFYPANLGEFINIEFTNFNLQLGDELSFYDGTSTAAPFIGTYSQTSNPGIVGASNTDGAITVVFTSNFTATNSGWQANISCALAPSFPNTAVMTDGASFTSCNAVFYDQGGANNSYLDNQNQTMTFLPENLGQSVRLNFTSFNLQSSDFLRIYDGRTTADPLIGSFTSGNPPGQIDPSNVDGALTVVFTSNFTATNVGWRADLTCTGTPLPISLKDFKVQEKNNLVEIFWSTTSEINNDYFIVERSKDITQWEKLAQVDGAGNSSQILNYSIIDEKPLPETSYYRLRQVDFDGQESYSQIQVVNRDKNENQEIIIYPNPAQDYAFIKSTSKANINLYTLLGKEITSFIKITESEGDIFSLDLRALSKGLYIVKVETKVIKLYKK